MTTSSEPRDERNQVAAAIAFELRGKPRGGQYVPGDGPTLEQLLERIVDLEAKVAAAQVTADGAASVASTALGEAASAMTAAHDAAAIARGVSR